MLVTAFNFHHTYSLFSIRRKFFVRVEAEELDALNLL